MVSSERSVSDLFHLYASAVRNRDADALMSLYHGTVRVFDAWGVWSYEGGPAWRKVVEQWFESLGDETLVVRFDDSQVVSGEELASATAIVTYAAMTAEGAPLRSMQNRLTWLLARENGAWKIVHEHTSAPIGFDDMKAILERK
ncbi:MAG: nuclear transport factor 2 family protein [Candidatus Eisenbacteria bacterium]|uniref:Nuclear transport factor 2 family protein n=1 Tax=Eiseniibacteriota bacterium TaxID=2212470 RepID=A0A956SDW5_UNCEI|nr:nuclear transport factor 2 family protein [Candidatus Eisenbacteria bacterium]